MKVYISCHHPDPANELAAALVAAGHEVVSTWHASGEVRPASDDAKAWAQKVMANFRLIDEVAQVLCLIAGDERYTGGKFVEAGYAFGRGKTVVVVGHVENGMLYHPLMPCCDTVQDAAELISELGVA